jgi:hypothetical protein
LIFGACCGGRQTGVDFVLDILSIYDYCPLFGMNFHRFGMRLCFGLIWNLDLVWFVVEYWRFSETGWQ